MVAATAWPAARADSRTIRLLVGFPAGGGTDAKLDAAATLGVPVVAVRRPPPPEGIGVVSSVDEAVAWIVRRPGAATPWWWETHH